MVFCFALSHCLDLSNRAGSRSADEAEIRSPPVVAALVSCSSKWQHSLKRVSVEEVSSFSTPQRYGLWRLYVSKNAHILQPVNFHTHAGSALGRSRNTGGVVASMRLSSQADVKASSVWSVVDQSASGPGVNGTDVRWIEKKIFDEHERISVAVRHDMGSESTSHVFEIIGQGDRIERMICNARAIKKNLGRHYNSSKRSTD